MMHMRPATAGSEPPLSLTVTASVVSCVVACAPLHAGGAVVKCTATPRSLRTRLHDAIGIGYGSTIDGLSVKTTPAASGASGGAVGPAQAAGAPHPERTMPAAIAAATARMYLR